MSNTNTPEATRAGSSGNTTTIPSIRNNNNNTKTTRRIINQKIIESVPIYWKVSNPDIGTLLGLTSSLIDKNTSFDILKENYTI